MKTCTPTLVLCRHRHRPDAACRMLPRCRRCGNRLWRNFDGLCGRCQQQAADAHAYRLLQAQKLIDEVMSAGERSAVKNGNR
jgi:hypothetical protein